VNGNERSKYYKWWETVYYLLKLSRNVVESERRQLKKKLERMLKREKTAKFKVMDDPWSKKGRILIEGFITREIIDFPDVWKVIELNTAGKIVHTLKDTTDLINDYLDTDSHGFDESGLEIKIHRNVPFHSKAILDRLNRKTPGEKRAYFEARKTVRGIEIRIGRILTSYNFISIPNVTLALISPRTKQEIADFIRLSIHFGVEVIISYETRENEIHDLMKKAKLIALGYQKAKIRLVGKNDEIFKDDYMPIGFSLWSHSTEKDMIKYITEIPPGKRLLLVFGNEDRGLPGKLREQLGRIYHLGPASSEPLKASQAASYALGVIAGQNL